MQTLKLFPKGFLADLKASLFIFVACSLLVVTPVSAQNGAPMDFDGDGIGDLATFDSSTATFTVRYSRSLEFRTQVVGESGAVPVPGFYDDNPQLDLATFDAVEARWTIHNSGDGTIVSRVFGHPADIPVPGRFTNWICTDLATYNPRTGVWNILDCRTRERRTENLGNGNGCRPVPANYDGDSRDDLAVFCPETLLWHVRSSRTGRVSKTAFGLFGDKPMPVASGYSADAAPGVYRPWASHFFGADTSGGVNMFSAFGLAGDQGLVGHYDGNLDPDVLVWRPTNQTFYLQTQPGNLFFEIPFPLEILGFPPIPPIAGLSLDDLICQVFPTAPQCSGGGSGTPTIPSDPFNPGAPEPDPLPIIPAAISFQPAPQPLTGVNYLNRTVPGDFTGNGSTDFAFINVSATSSALEWRILDPMSGQLSEFIHGAPGDTILAGDFNGTGRVDPTVVRKTSDGLLTWAITGKGAGIEQRKFGLATTDDYPIVGDFDCDRHADLAVVRDDGTFLHWYIQTSSGEADASVQGIMFGLKGDKPMVGDPDNRGCSALMVAREDHTYTGGMMWFHRYLAGENESSSPAASLFGLAWTNDVPYRPLDFTGDGKEDRIVTREMGGGLYHFVQTPWGADAHAWGLPGDITVIGYFSGVSSNPEIAIVRPSDRRIYIRQFNGALKIIDVPRQVTHIVLPDGRPAVSLGGGDGTGPGNVSCDVTHDFRDGEREGALWKPYSDNTGRPVFLLPASYWFTVRGDGIHVYGNDGTLVVNGSKRTCCPNGGRAHYDVPRSASSLAAHMPLTIQLEMSNGTTECRTVPDPRQRWD